MAIGYDDMVYLGRDDMIRWCVLTDDTPVNLLGVTRMTLHFGGGVVIDSDVSAMVFDWRTRGADGIVTIMLGAQTIAPGNYLVLLTVYDSSYSNGISGWGHRRIKVTRPEGESLQ